MAKGNNSALWAGLGAVAVAAGIVAFKRGARAAPAVSAPSLKSGTQIWLGGNGARPASTFADVVNVAPQFVQSAPVVHYVNVPAGVTPAAGDLGYFASDANGTSIIP